MNDKIDLSCFSLQEIMDLAEEQLKHREAIKVNMKRYNLKKAEKKAESLGVSYADYKRLYHAGRKRKVVEEEQAV